MNIGMMKRTFTFTKVDIMADYSKEEFEVENEYYLDLKVIGMPLYDVLMYKITNKELRLDDDKINICKKSASHTITLRGNCARVIYVDIFEYDVVSHAINRESDYLIKKRDFEPRIIKVRPGVILNESSEILLQITKSLYDDSFTLYISTEIIKQPIYASLYSKVKKHLIKPFEEENFTIVTMDMQKLTKLFNPEYEEDNDSLPLMIEFNDR